MDSFSVYAHAPSIRKSHSSPSRMDLRVVRTRREEAWNPCVKPQTSPCAWYAYFASPLRPLLLHHRRREEPRPRRVSSKHRVKASARPLRLHFLRSGGEVGGRALADGKQVREEGEEEDGHVQAAEGGRTRRRRRLRHGRGGPHHVKARCPRGSGGERRARHQHVESWMQVFEYYLTHKKRDFTAIVHRKRERGGGVDKERERGGGLIRGARRPPYIWRYRKSTLIRSCSVDSTFTCRVCSSSPCDFSVSCSSFSGCRPEGDMSQKVDVAEALE
jgi:hypothetical protein